MGLFVAQALLALVNLPVSIILARGLGVAAVGEYQLLYRLAFLSISVAHVGYPHAVAWAIRECDDERARSAVMRSAFGVSTIQGAIVFAAGAACIGLNPTPASGTTWLILALYPLFNLISAAVLNVFRGELRVKPIAVSRLVQAILWLGSVVALYATQHLTVESAIATLVAAQAVGTAVAVSFALSSGLLSLDGSFLFLGRPRLSQRRTRLFALAVYPGLMVRDWNVYLDQVIVGLFLGTTELGLYAVAVAVSSSLTLLGGPISNTAQPLIQEAIKRGREGDVIPTVLASILFTVGAAAIILGIVATLLIPTIFGMQFVPAITLMQLLCIGSIFDNLNSCLHGILLGVGRPRDSSRSTLLGLIVNIAGWLILLPTLGVVGAAVTSISAYIVVSISMARATARAIHISVWQLFVRIWKSRSEAIKVPLTSAASIISRKRRH